MEKIKLVYVNTKFQSPQHQEVFTKVLLTRWACSMCHIPAANIMDAISSSTLLDTVFSSSSIMLDHLNLYGHESKTIIGWCSCDIQDNKGQDRGYQLKPKAAAFENLLCIFSQSKKRQWVECIIVKII